MFITSYRCHLEECKNFFLLPVRKRIFDDLRADLKAGWQTEVYNTSFEQFKINGNHRVPRFKTMADYQKFLDHYYHAFERIVINKGYALPGAGERVDRGFIRENIR